MSSPLSEAHRKGGFLIVSVKNFAFNFYKKHNVRVEKLAGLSNISPTMMIVGLLVIFLVYSIAKAYMTKDQVYCSLIRRDKTQIHKWAKANQERIDIDGGWYFIDIKCIVVKFVFIGIVPTWIRCLNYRYNSSHPINPETGDNSYDDPKERKALDRSISIQSLMNKQNTILGAKAGKKSFLESLMPIILICGLLILGYMGYQNMKKCDLLGAGQNYIEGKFDNFQQQLDQIKSNTGK